MGNGRLTPHYSTCRSIVVLSSDLLPDYYNTTLLSILLSYYTSSIPVLWSRGTLDWGEQVSERIE